MYLIEMVTEMKNTVDMVLLAGHQGSMVSNIKGGGELDSPLLTKKNSRFQRNSINDSLGSILRSPSPER